MYVLVPVNKVVLDFVVLFIFLNCSSKGEVQTTRNDCTFSVKTQREGQANHERQISMSCKFPINLSSVQNGCSQMVLKHKAGKDALKNACQELPFVGVGFSETGSHVAQAGLKLTL